MKEGSQKTDYRTKVSKLLEDLSPVTDQPTNTSCSTHTKTYILQSSEPPPINVNSDAISDISSDKVTESKLNYVFSLCEICMNNFLSKNNYFNF